MNGIESSKRKVDRAAVHIKALQRAVHKYTADESNLVVDESGGAKKLRFLNDRPPSIAILAGEVVYQLRSALDHLAFELVKLNPTRASLPNRWDRNCRFPLCLSIPTRGNPPIALPVPLPFNHFKESLPGITVAAFAFIEALQPYNGGSGPMQLGWLEELANIDKHRHFHIVNPNAYQTEHVRSTRLDSEMILRLQDGAEIRCSLHSADELEDAVYVERGIRHPFISFDESELPPDITDVPIDNVLELCARTISVVVVPGFENLIQNP